MSDLSRFQQFLQAIAPYVVVVGSWARNAETEDSDIDCFLRFRPVEEVDLEIQNETYMEEVLEIINSLNLDWSSVIVGHVAVERTSSDIERMVEISNHYRIPSTSVPFWRTIHGVDMLCAPDDKNADIDDCMGVPIWDDTIQDICIRYPLPAYSDVKKRMP